MTTWEIMSRTEADAVWARESILYGDSDGIPLKRAAELAGADALEWARENGQTHKRIAINGYGIGEPGTAKYLTRWGWNMAVTYNNVKATLE